MPVWKPEIRRRLTGLQLAPVREAAIVEELAQPGQAQYDLVSELQRLAGARAII